jgi:hypothetical protein
VAEERDSPAALRPVMSRTGSLAELHAWLYSEHAAYAVGGRPTRASGALRESY